MEHCLLPLPLHPPVPLLFALAQLPPLQQHRGD